MRNNNSIVFTPLALKIVGVIVILSSLFDYILLLLPFNPTDKIWQLSTTGQLVDRGIIPLVGIAFLMAGYWMSSSAGTAPAPRPFWQSLRFWTFLLSSFLGLVFLLLVPLHLLNISTQQSVALTRINQEASAYEAQLQNQLQQVDALLKNEQKLKELDQTINGGQVQGEQLARLQNLKEQLQKFKQDPKALNQQLEEAQTKIRSQKLQAEQKAKQEALKSAVRTGASSLLLAVGYIAIGWTGLMSMLAFQGTRRKPKTR